MTIQKKTLIALFTLSCFTLIIFVFNSFNVTNGEAYLSVLGGGTADMTTGEFDLLNFNFLPFAIAPLKMISAVVACSSIVIVLLTYSIYRKHYKKSTGKYFRVN